MDLQALISYDSAMAFFYFHSYITKELFCWISFIRLYVNIDT